MLLNSSQELDNPVQAGNALICIIRAGCFSLGRYFSVVGMVVALASMQLSALESEPIYAVNFRMLALPPLQENVPGGMGGQDYTINNVSYTSGGRTNTIASIPYLSQSKQYRYEGPSPLIFYREARRTGDGTERKILAEVDISGGLKDILILALPRDNNAASGFATSVLADDWKSFPHNSFRIINFSNDQLAYLLDNERHMVDPRGVSFVQLPITQPRMVPFKLATFDAESNGWRETSSTSIAFYGISRVLCLVLPELSGKNRHSRPMIILDLDLEVESEDEQGSRRR